MANEFDLIVIGSGPGGYVAAIRAAQLGLATAVVEKDPYYGGTCLHRGCIPTKALLHTASMLDEIRSSDKIGLAVAAPELDMAKTHAYKNGVVAKNAQGVAALFKKNRITGIHGTGRLAGPHTVAVERDGETTTYEAKHVLIATGSVPRELPFAPADGRRVINSDHALELETVPASLTVLGAGAVGCEFASIYASFGCRVTLVEMLPRLLPLEDEELSTELARAFKKRGIKSLTATKVTEVDAGGASVRMALESGGGERSEHESELLLVAVGRAPVTAGLGLEELGIGLDRGGYVEVDAYMRTALPHVYAIGDVVATPWLAHVASSEGILAVEHLAGEEVQPINYDHVPSCTYCVPEVASVGLSEAAARERGYDVATGKFPFAALGKARILQHPEGFVKVVRETKYDELLGVHVIGPHATDLIAEACVALRVESTTEELLRTMHAHPTLSEAVMEAAHVAFGHGIHI